MANPDFTGILSSDRSGFEGELPGSIHFGIQGPPGPPGKDGTVAFEDLTAEQIESLRGRPGPSGKTAYEYAQNGGYTGSETDFAAKLAMEYLPLSGGDMTGELRMNGHKISGLNAPTEDDEPATKGYTASQITDRVIYGKGKNLLKNTAKSETRNGITFTVNEDGSVTANGTATNTTIFVIGYVSVKTGIDYICNSGTDLLGYSFRLDNDATVIHDFATNNTYTPNSDNRYEVCIRVGNGKTVNETSYPMVRLASETDDTYEPYYEGLKELTYRTKLLWENPSPTSKFETKTLDVDLSDYQYFMVEYYAANNEKQIYSERGKVGGYCHFKYSTTTATSVVEATRIVSSTSNTVTFNTCWKWQNTSGGFTFVENDFLLIPVRIYGVKGVFA